MKKIRLAIIAVLIVSGGVVLACERSESVLNVQKVANQILQALEMEPWFWPGAMHEGAMHNFIERFITSERYSSNEQAVLQADRVAIFSQVELLIQSSMPIVSEPVLASDDDVWKLDNPQGAEQPIFESTPPACPSEYELLRAKAGQPQRPRTVSVSVQHHKSVYRTRALMLSDSKEPEPFRYREWLAQQKQLIRSQSCLRHECLGDEPMLVQAKQIAKRLFRFGFGQYSNQVLLGHIEHYLHMLPISEELPLSRAVLVEIRQLQASA